MDESSNEIVNSKDNGKPENVQDFLEERLANHQDWAIDKGFNFLSFCKTISALNTKALKSEVVSAVVNFITRLCRTLARESCARKLQV